MSKRVTSADVADHLGISRSTVSRAFTPGARVAFQTKERIHQVAKELGYSPNAYARSLVSAETKVVGILMTEFLNPFASHMAQRLTTALRDEGIDSAFINLPPACDVGSILPMIKQLAVDSIVITSLEVSPGMVRALRSEGFPVILLNRVLYDSGAVSVCADLEQGGELAALHLLQGGYERPAIIQGRAGTWTSRMREKGFRLGLHGSGVEVCGAEPGNYTYEGGYQATQRLFEDRQKPDFVFCANDLIAIGCKDALKELGYSAPQVGIIGFDDIPMVSWKAYEISSIKLPVDEMVAVVANTLKEDTSARKPGEYTTLIPCQLVNRGSATRDS